MSLVDWIVLGVILLCAGAAAHHLLRGRRGCCGSCQKCGACRRK